jgi:hypothetical protein
MAAAVAGTDTSDNWSGGIVNAPSGTFTSVSGQWTIPNPVATTNDGTRYYSSFWIGIDGSGGSSDVFQAGVECEAVGGSGGAQQTIYPWWEWYPEDEVQITNLPTAVGDVLSCALTVVSSTSGNVFLKNVTNGTAVSFQISPPPGTTLVGNCAEWIAERPEVDGALTELVDYGEVNFSSCDAGASAGATVQSSSGDSINMLDGTQTISQAALTGPDEVSCTYTGPTPSGPG